MVHESGIPDFSVWLPQALQWFLIITSAFVTLCVLGGFLISAAQHGPTEGFYRTSKVIFSAVLEDWKFIFGPLVACGVLSLPVIYALTKLAAKQSTGSSSAGWLIGSIINIFFWSYLYKNYKSELAEFDLRVNGFSGFLRRVLAIAWLCVQESIRKRVLFTVFGVFVVIMIFAGWFLDPRNDSPARIYLSFVLGTSNWLVLLLSIFLATLSLPNDMKTKTIYTIVTKPVRSSEIVLGRILGFVGIGTAMIGIMGLLSYVFVTRGLTHTHTVEAESIEAIRADDEARKIVGYRGKTSLASGHRHDFDVPLSGDGGTKTSYGHSHKVTRRDDGTYEVGPPEGLLEARMPIYGKLNWFDRSGKATGRGISVGDEWEYRHYIAGGTRAAAVWRFSGITKERFPNGIPLEITLQVFRTYKGDIEKPVLGSIAFRNPDVAVAKESAPDLRRFKEFETDSYTVPLKLKRIANVERVTSAAKEGKIVEELDLFEDLVNDRGELEVLIRCAEPGQYYGAAQADVYIRANDGSFFVNFTKCLLSLWVQMVMIVTFGVLFSTFLSGPVAFLASISTLVVGFFMSFIQEVVHGIYNPTDEMAYTGGGPIESVIRIMTQQNMQTELEIGPMLDSIIKKIDGVFAALLYSATFVIPDYTQFDSVDYVAYGYNIPGAVLGIMLCKAFVYAIGSTILGYFVLKTREVAA
jgi:hypothetical protein